VRFVRHLIVFLAVEVEVVLRNAYSGVLKRYCDISRKKKQHSGVLKRYCDIRPHGFDSEVCVTPRSPKFFFLKK
jgi:hypothetical protein